MKPPVCHQYSEFVTLQCLEDVFDDCQRWFGEDRAAFVGFRYFPCPDESTGILTGYRREGGNTQIRIISNRPVYRITSNHP